MLKRKTYLIRTFGCQMNEAESGQIAAWYEARGWKRVKNWQVADEIVINSCSVRESAENRVFGLINNINKFKLKTQSFVSPARFAKASARRAGGSKIKATDQSLKLKKLRIILTGCMVGSALGERRRYSLKQLKQKLPPEVEIRSWDFWGFEKIKAFETRKRLLKGRSRPKADGPLAQASGQKKALVPISYGCDHFCTYCVVPYAKGKERSRPFEEIICEVKELVRRGWSEIVLLGQNVNSYGNDFSRKEKQRLISCYHDTNHSSKDSGMFSLLLRTIHQIDMVKKISFMTANPWDFTDEIIQAIKLPKVDRYLHLPLQSGDNLILAKMSRPYTARNYFKLVKKIRKEIPEIKIGTDIIVGFPGETKKAFEKTVRICKKIGFIKAYIAEYSPRPGTAAFNLKNDVLVSEKKKRWQILEQLINKRTDHKK